jgi:hypothetical protein
MFPGPDFLVSRTHIAYECGNFSDAYCACPFVLHDRGDRQLIVRLFRHPAKAGPGACPWLERGATAGTLAAPGFLAFAGMTVRLDIGVSIASPIPRKEATPLLAAMASGVITARSWSGAASATNYRKSGLVLRRFPVVPARPRDGRCRA